MSYSYKSFLTYFACLLLGTGSIWSQKGLASDLSEETNTPYSSHLFRGDNEISNHELDLKWTHNRWEDYGDYAQYGLPLLAFAISKAQNDHSGATHLMESCATSVGTVHILKRLFNYTVLGERPNSGISSFPSGHTIGAVCGAAYLQSRYGVDYGAPALMMAAHVGGSRVHRNTHSDTSPHHIRDVIASFIIGYTVSELMVPRHTTYKSHSAQGSFNRNATPVFQYSRTFSGYGIERHDPFDMTIEIAKENNNSHGDDHHMRVTFSYSF